MNKKPIITAIESDNDGYLTITVKGKDAKRVARVVKYADEMLDMLENLYLDDDFEYVYGDTTVKCVGDIIAKTKGADHE